VQDFVVSWLATSVPHDHAEIVSYEVIT
jgi:hypothetical protein